MIKRPKFLTDDNAQEKNKLNTPRKSHRSEQINIATYDKNKGEKRQNMFQVSERKASATNVCETGCKKPN